MTTLSRRDTFRFATALATTSAGLCAIAPGQVAAAAPPIMPELILPRRNIQQIILSVTMADDRDTYVIGLYPGHDCIDATRLEYPRQRTMKFDRPENVDLVEAAVCCLLSEVDREIPLSTLTPKVYPKFEDVWPTD